MQCRPIARVQHYGKARGPDLGYAAGMNPFSLCLALPILALSGLHLLWALGIWFPLRSEVALAHAATGFPSAATMPSPLLCALVAAVLLIGASLPFWPESPMRSLMIWGMAAIFVGRGAVTYTAFWRRLTPVEPFATLDRRYYGPLCLILGALSAAVA